MGIRLVVALACVAGIVVSLIARDSRLTQEDAFAAYINERDSATALRLLRDSRTLNPDFASDVGEARLDRRNGVRILERAVEREPDNWELWMRLSQQQRAAGDRAGSQRSWARSRRLAPLLPAQGPPPGL